MNLIKITLIIVILSIQLTFSYGQRQYDWKSYNLKGRVASFHEYTYKAYEKFGEVTKGNLVDEAHFKFNETGQVIEHKFSVRDVFGGKEDELTRFYQYDEKGFSIEANDKKNRIIYKNDINGNIVEEAVYNRDGNLRSKTRYKYDGNNCLIEELMNSSGLEKRITYKYDVDGNRIQMTTFMLESKMGTVITKYDSKGNAVKDMEDIVISNLKIEHEYKYVFDEYGNFLSKTIFSNNSSNGRIYDPAVSQIIERTIEYELTLEQKEKIRIEEEKRMIAEEKRKKEEVEKERLRQENERILKEKIEKERKEKEYKELLSFLKERKTIYYDLNTLSKADFSEVQNEMKRILYSIIRDSKFSDININGQLLITADTLGYVNIRTAELISNQNEVVKSITDMSNTITIPSQQIRGYKVNVKANTEIKWIKRIVDFKLKKSNEIVYSKNEPTENIKRVIRKTYNIDSKGQNFGNYTVEYFYGYINDFENEEVKTLKHKEGVDVGKVIGTIIESY